MHKITYNNIECRILKKNKETLQYWIEYSSGYYTSVNVRKWVAMSELTFPKFSELII